MNAVLFRTGRRPSAFAKPGTLCLIPTICLAAFLALLWPTAGRAVPYASGLTNLQGIIFFYLNESAHNVSVVFDGGSGGTNDLGALAAGQHSFDLAGHASFQLVVSKSAPEGWTLISSDTNPLLQFNSPRGVAVNFNTNSPAFGRIYVANSSAGNTGTGRALGDGLYLLNPDQSDALGRGTNASAAGLIFNSGGGQVNTPWRIEVGPDNFLYIADFSTNTGTIYRTDADVSAGSGINVLANFGVTNQSVHTTIGSSPIVRGFLQSNNLTIWAIDGRFPPAGNYNRLYRWDIGGGPLPYNAVPVALANPLINNVLDVTTDLDRGPDGKFYLMQNRSAGNEAGLFVYSSDGVTRLWDSLAQSRSISNNPAATDILRTSRAVKVSADGSKVAIIRDDLQTWIIPLINGIPDLTNRQEVTTYSGSPTTLGRDVCFDPAGNLYALSSGNQLLRIFSPGGVTTATTGSDSTLQVTVVHVPLVSVTAIDAVAAEDGLDPGTFRLTRTGDTSTSLTVNYTLTGTASNGVDYLGDSLSTNFPVGASSVDVTITPIDDTEAELTENVVLTLSFGSMYTVGTATNATINIVDNEYPNVVTLTATDTNIYERFPGDTGAFTLTRYGETNSELIILFQFSGSAIESADYTLSPATVTLEPGTVTKSISIIPQDDQEIEGPEIAILTLFLGLDDWSPGEPNSAAFQIRDDEWLSAPILFSDDFDVDTSANWVSRFGANNGIYDATNIFAYDYVTAGIPLAPHSAPNGGEGLYVAVNKFNATAGGAAGINFYPAGKSFSGDYALRFDMFLSFGTAGTTEHAIAGLNHSSLQTNRVTQSADPNNTTRGCDGVWVAIETDASDNRDYTAYTTTNADTLPVMIASQTAGAMTNVITSPPFAFAGSPGNGPTSTKAWASVELSQVGNLITLRVDDTSVFTVTNSTSFTNGDVMIGHNDQFDSIGSAANFVIFDNVQVVSLAVQVTEIHVSVNEVLIDFIAPAGGTAGDFHLQTSASLGPSDWHDDDSAMIMRNGYGFRAATMPSGDTRFYRIRR